MMSTQHDDPKESLVGAPPSFDHLIREKFRGTCGNCGSDHKLRVRMIVPEEAGGQKIESNGILLCRPCELAMETSKPSDKPSRPRPVNFWVSQALSQRLHSMIAKGQADGRFKFRSIGALVRYLMLSYIKDPDRYDDLERYQDAAVEAVGVAKINVWIPQDHYETFKACVNRRGMSVTQCIKSLIELFYEETLNV